MAESDILRIVKAYVEASGNRGGDFKRHTVAARRLLARCGGDADEAVEHIRDTKRWAKREGIKFSLYTVLKRFGKDNGPERITRRNDGPKSIKDILKNIPRRV